jgi:AraC-like DNA-binding protein
MPLFMDLHKASDYETKPTVEDIKKNHIADLAVQYKYGVKFLQYWINEEAGLVFCLMEAPDKESCVAVHQEAHGGMPCNVVELRGGDYVGFMGNAFTVNKFDIVENADGTFDTGYRTILMMDYIQLDAAGDTMRTVYNIIEKAGGRIIKRPGQRDMFVFLSVMAAIDCGLQISDQVREDKNSTEIGIGISAGEPVTMQQEIFGSSIQLANNLCTIAQNGQVLVSAFAKQLAGEHFSKEYRDNETIRSLIPQEEQFLEQFLQENASQFYKPTFDVAELCRSLGMSRSKLYRKITELTGLSANVFIRELKLRKALQLMKEKYGNVNEVAMEAGFNTTTYFSQCFQKRFGILPTQFLKSVV